MSSVADIPVKVELEAAQRVAELGLQRELQQMIEYARGNTWGVRGIHVTLERDRECPHNDPIVCLWIYRDVPPEGPARDQTPWKWSAWRTETFPPEVTLHICMTTAYGGPDGR